MKDSRQETRDFRKRFFRSPVKVIVYMFRVNIAIFKMIFSSSASRGTGAFRERLNLAVCGVNECIYCTHLHTKTALKAGVTPQQAADILAGEDGNVPPEEAKAVAFARYWADQGGDGRTDQYPALVEAYGPSRAGMIMATLHMIQAGNMCSNTAEAFRLGAVTERRVAFFFAWLLAAPVALAVKLMGGYREPADQT